ncbi:MAG: DUF1311 domain-containing protein [Methylobacterium frigidaeris]
MAEIRVAREPVSPMPARCLPAVAVLLLLASPWRAHAQTGEACGMGEGPALDACVAKQARNATDSLARTYKAAVAAGDSACADVGAPVQVYCLGKAQDLADHALNDLYRRMQAGIDKNAPSKTDAAKWKDDLKAAQQAWIKYRDADCSDLVATEYHHGTGMGAGMGSCTLMKTAARVQELQDRYGNFYKD